MKTSHTQARLYMGEGTYSLDFYFDVQDPRYMFQATKAIEDYDKEIQAGGMQLQLQDIPFYFTQCPHCKVEILTNRVVGKGITCQQCEGRHKTEVYIFEKSESYLEVINNGQELLNEINPMVDQLMGLRGLQDKIDELKKIMEDLKDKSE